MHSRPYYFFLIFLLSFAGCRQKDVQAADPRLVTDTLMINFTDSLRVETRLLPEAAQITQGYSGYNTLSQDLKTLNHSVIGSLKIEIDSWVDAAKQLHENLNGDDTNNAINARMLVLNTKVNLLKQEIDKRVIDTAVINQEATEFYNAFQDLGFQLNLKFGKSVDELLNDFKKENVKRRLKIQDEEQD